MCVGVCMCVFFQKFGKVAIFVYAHIRRFSGIICKSRKKGEIVSKHMFKALQQKKSEHFIFILKVTRGISFSKVKDN